MMQRIGWFVVTVVLITVAASAVGAQTADPMEAVRAASEALEAYSATIRMTQHQARGDSVIEFSFDFVPPDRMRIVYSAPNTVKGQTMILNGDRFYTYIPSLHREVWQDVGDGEGNQGEEMGFLYDFVTRSVSEVLESATTEVSETRETYVLEGTEELLDVDILTLITAEDRQVVWLNAVDATPVAVAIYTGDELAMEIQVLDYCVDGASDESWFTIPEK
jgi:outer membrane lipoprotein-sorting protein